jgi:four helix bundle protein
MRDYKKYNVWELGHKLVLKIYIVSKTFPREEVYGISSQLKRAAVSIPTNIAEGCSRKSDKEFARFLDISFGSAAETEYLILLVKDLKFINEDDFIEISNEIISIKKQLYQLIYKINADGIKLKADC